MSFFRHFSDHDPDTLHPVLMLGLIGNFETDPDSLSNAEKKVVVTKEGNPIFGAGPLT